MVFSHLLPVVMEEWKMISKIIQLSLSAAKIEYAEKIGMSKIQRSKVAANSSFLSPFSLTERSRCPSVPQSTAYTSTELCAAGSLILPRSALGTCLVLETILFLNPMSSIIA